MTVPEQVRLAEWMLHIVDGGEHEGRNKPSWVHGGRVIKGAQVYRDHNIWHYHCGPFTTPAPANYRPTDNTLAENNFGRPSGEVYHYAKHGDVVIVIGYSRIHVPFPDAMSRSNPLRNRAYAWKKGMPPPQG